MKIVEKIVIRQHIKPVVLVIKQRMKFLFKATFLTLKDE